MLKRWFAWAAAALRGRAPRGSEEPEQLLSRDQATAIFDEEIARRDWTAFDLRDYTTARAEGRAVWRCRGFVSGRLGGVMHLEIDAQTGALIRASVGGR